MSSIRTYLFLTILVMALSCRTAYHPTALHYSTYGVNDAQRKDSAVLSMLRPYADTVTLKMGDVIGEMARQLIKKPVDGNLCHFMADAYLAMARSRFEPRADVAFMNLGGVRLPSLEAGKIKRGTIYELMPFDNVMEIIAVRGELLQKFLDHIAEREACGGVAGITLTIRDKKATEVRVGGKPLDPNATYYMVNSDYVVNGGGGFVEFRDLARRQTGYFLRDALLDYCESFTREGKKIDVTDEKRISL
jgi:2',3'-cyclic-nucleotide 2'-phosphodiesterase (5'-nucleotidase family)